MRASEPVVALTLAQRSLVTQILHDVLAQPEAYVFGSRATGRARPFSDLDLLLVQPPWLNWAQRAELRDRFEASDLPFQVDIVAQSDLSGEMAERVAAERVPLSG